MKLVIISEIIPEREEKIILRVWGKVMTSEPVSSSEMLQWWRAHRSSSSSSSWPPSSSWTPSPASSPAPQSAPASGKMVSFVLNLLPTFERNWWPQWPHLKTEMWKCCSYLQMMALFFLYLIEFRLILYWKSRGCFGIRAVASSDHNR